MRQSAVSFKVKAKPKDLNIEGIIAQPEEETGLFPAVVICHPHPLFGGNMDNNVVFAVSAALVDQGFATLRFNFRGVGNSEGTHTKGELEHQEVLAAIDLIKAWPKVDRRTIGLVGYSFGSSVILAYTGFSRAAKVFAFISPPLHALESTPLKTNKRPKLVIVGDRDRLVQSAQLPIVLQSFTQTPVSQIIAGADHGWSGYEDQLSEQVAQFFVASLK